ncbi:glutamate receptor ionotropic, kainate glr-3-like [Macrobrachium rosenbergii]|uniref:glutamate receptor ionotropic, kainate glr-3-like n=1 Tax=Macrobrachium rosenbergii TaxID=79674 RepID=UPI0034D5AB44
MKEELAALSDSNIEEHLDQVYIPINSKVIVALVDVNSRNATFLEAYKVAPKMPIRLHAIGKWLFNSNSSDNSLRKTLPVNKSLFLDEFKDLPNQRRLAYRKMKYGIMAYIKGDLIIRRRDLTGLHLNCTVIETPPFVFIKRRRPDGTVSLQGPTADLFYLLQKVTNFSSSCRMVRDNAWGSFLNGRWNGVIGEIIEGTADIAVTTIDITPKRSEVVDFLMEVTTTSHPVVFKRASNSDQRWAAYTREFQKNIWIIFGIFCILLVLLFAIFVSLSPLGSQLSPTDAVHIAVGFLLGQGTSISVSATSLRMLMLTSLMFHTLMLTHYASDLMSGLAAGDPRLPISDLTDIAENPKFTLAYSKSTSVDEYLSKSPVAAHRKIWQDSHDRGSANEHSPKHSLDLALTKRGYFAMLPKDYFLHHSGNDCRFLTLKRDYFQNGMSFALKKNSPVKPILNNIILRMLSSGILEKLGREAKVTRAACDNLEVAPIGLSSITAPLCLLGCGVIAACVFLLLELVVAKWRAVA